MIQEGGIYTCNGLGMIVLYIDDEDVYVYDFQLKQDRTKDKIEENLRNGVICESGINCKYIEFFKDIVDGYLGKVNENLKSMLDKVLYASTTFEKIRLY